MKKKKYSIVLTAEQLAMCGLLASITNCIGGVPPLTNKDQVVLVITPKNLGKTSKVDLQVG